MSQVTKIQNPPEMSFIAQKRQKMSKNTETNANLLNPKPTKITHLNSDCLEYIFKKLKLSDLMTVADSTKQFNVVIYSVFKQKYGNKRVAIAFSSYPTQYDSELEFNDLSNQLQVLRCFGHLINRLTLNWSYFTMKTDEKIDFLEQYITTYCSESLQDIEFTFPNQAIMKKIDKPFKNVRNVSFKGKLYAGSFGAMVPNLCKWFPGLRELSFDSANWNDRSVAECIEHHFSYLEKVDLTVGEKNDQFSMSNIAKFLHLNPKLNRFKLKVCNVQWLLDNDIEELELPERFELILASSDGDRMKMIQLQNVKFFKYYEFNEYTFPFCFDRLEEMELWLPVSFDKLDRLYAFLGNHRTLKKLQLNVTDGRKRTVNWKYQLAEASKGLREIRLFGAAFTVSEVAEFLESCPGLEAFTFRLRYNEDLTAVTNAFDNFWNISQRMIAHKRAVVLERLDY